MAENDWILEVLGDIIKFAGKNDLPRIRAALLDVERVAHSELQIEKTDVHYLHLAEPSPLKWSAPIVRKAEDHRWPLRDPSPKRLS